MSETKTNIEQTQVSDEQLENLLGMPGADSVITPAEEDSKPSFFGNNETDMSAFSGETPPADPPAEEEEEKGEGGEAGGAEPAATESFDNIVSEVEPVEEDNEPSPGGRPKLNKVGMAQLVDNLVKNKLIVPFDDDKPLDQYTEKDYQELFEANFAERERKIREETPAEFFQSLPPELQHAAQYVASGGTDLKGLFKHLASVEEVRDLDPNSERGSETIVREYLRATQFGSEEDIQEEIDSWRDLGKLGEKAMKFQPKLDSMREQIVQQKVAQAEAKRKQNEEMSYRYMQDVYGTLDKEDLNGLPLNSKVQNMLYAGLVQPNYPSISGKPTNLFGHLIEKYQFVEPRHDLIAEALWLLADPDGYKKEVANNAKKEVVSETVRTLKTEQANKHSSTGGDPDTEQPERRGIPRPTKNFFKR